MTKDKSRMKGSKVKTQPWADMDIPVSRFFRCVLPFPSDNLYNRTAIHLKKVLQSVACMKIAADMRQTHGLNLVNLAEL